jgi:hypothetical protein
MKELLRKPIFVFFMVMLLIALPLFLFPINLFEGEIVYQIGALQHVEPAPLSLSYFLGLGYAPEDMFGVQDFYLTRNGYILAALLILGFPALLAYRVKMRMK